MLCLLKTQRKRIYWQLRYYVNVIRFLINKVFFKVAEQKTSIKEHFSITKELLRLVLKSIVFSIAVLFLFKWFDHLLVVYNSISNNNFLISLQTKVASNSIVAITLFSIIASISGLFLGLYFTAISVVSSTYVRFPDSIRSLLLREKVGNFYINILSVTTVLSILLIADKVFWNGPGILLSLFVLLLGCFGIFCFGLLGIRAFFFFDPSQFCDALFQDIIKYVRWATISGFKCFDQNFQAHYQRMAAQKIKTLRALVEICINEKHLQESSLLPLLTKTVGLLEVYQIERAKIPSDSRWYSRTPVHKNWFLSDSSSFALAMESHSFIQPDMVPNAYWFEDEIADIFEYSLKNMLSQKNIQLASDFLNSLCGYFEKTGYDLEIQNNIAFINKLMPALDSYFSSLSPKDKEFEQYEDAQIGLLEVWSVCIMSAPLGFYKLSRDLKIEDISNRIKRICWTNTVSLYKNGFPPLLLSRLEYLQKRLKFEYSVEGKIITPTWYTRQLIIGRHLDVFKECLDKLLESLSSIFISKSNALIEKKLFMLSALFSKRGLETCTKMRANFSYLEKTVKLIIEKEIVEKDIPYSIINWDDVRNKINEAYGKLIEIQGKCLPALSFIKRPKNWPDVFGQTYNTVCHETYRSLIEKDQNKFSMLFPLLFFGAIVASENLRAELSDRDVEVIVSIMSEPLLDILNLSGYSKIYSELYNEPKLWQACSSVWDEYLKKQKNKKPLLEKLIGLQEYRKNKFQIFPRDTLRTNWGLMLQHKLREMNLIDGMLESSPWRDQKNKHTSALIRALCQGRYIHTSADEVFILTYLLKQPEAIDIKYQDRFGLNKSI